MAHCRIAGGRVKVDGEVITQHQHEVDRFMMVEMEGEVIQKAERALYVMLNKPTGYVSATRDEEHPTVLDLIDDPDKSTLHLVGRLDRYTSGMLLLTNDGRWSKRLMDAASKVPKVYLVETAEPIAPEAKLAFAEGFHFAAEGITTLPAELEILGECRARVTLHEGRHHQIKRMFGRLQNLVVGLHRESIGALRLPTDLRPGEWRFLTREECVAATNPSADTYKKAE